MSDKTKIEWTDATWNPVTGCTRVSPGCENCYIDRTPPFRIEGRHFTVPCELCGGGGFEPMAGKFRDSHACSVCSGEGEVRSHAIGSTTGVRLHPERLDQPLRWRRPRRIFVNSLSDLFHDDVPDEYIARVWAVMALSSQHTFQVLTKRHARMRSLLNSADFQVAVSHAQGWWVDFHDDPDPADGGICERCRDNVPHRPVPWPLPNVWVGVTVEDQERADLRVPILLGTPATVRFLSCEPMLGPVDLRRAIEPNFARGGWRDLSRLHWVIAGGESGPDARPMHPDWARSLRDQCTMAGIAFHFKQWGEWVTEEQSPEGITLPSTSWLHLGEHQPSVYKVGKKAAGRELDGRTWDEMPKAES